MKVYLAGASSELPRVLKYVAELEQRGVTLSYPWWQAVQKHGPGNDGALSQDAQERYAKADLAGVLDADVVWALWPNARSMGAPFEVGYAIANGLPVVATGERAHECIFLALATHRGASDEEGMAVVLRLLGSAHG